MSERDAQANGRHDGRVSSYRVAQAGDMATQFQVRHYRTGLRFYRNTKEDLLYQCNQSQVRIRLAFGNKHLMVSAMVELIN